MKRLSAEPSAASTAPPSGTGSLGLESIWRACESSIGESPPDGLLGRELGGVTLVRIIADGGMGRVYEGLQQQPRRPVAVKVLRPGLLSRQRVRRFLHELEILGRLRHPAISQVYSAGTYDTDGAQLPFFVMELVPDALPITDYARRRDLDLRSRVALLVEVCDAVAQGHGQGIVHRDIKPRNILVDAHGRPKVIDFGVARATSGEEHESSLTVAGQLVGTLQYMSPEGLATGAADVGPPADVYALGLVLHELLVDRLPYDVARLGVVEAARVIEAYRPPRFGAGRRGLPRPLVAAVDRCLARAPDRRFPDAAALAAALRGWLDGSDARGRPPLVPALLAGGAVVALAAILAWPRATPPAEGFVPTASVVPPPTEAGAESATSKPEPVMAAVDVDGECHYGFQTVTQAEPYVVRKVNVREYTEKSDPPLVYWGTALNDVEGFVELRFEFPRPTLSATLSVALHCWDFMDDTSQGVGRGAAAVEVSADGRTWHTLIDDIGMQRWGTWQNNAVLDLPAEACGGETIWVRCRILTEFSANVDYSTAQIGRQEHHVEAPRPALALTAQLAD